MDMAAIRAQQRAQAGETKARAAGGCPEEPSRLA
jgi:hypothetical protein